jgi:hypothetical protein
MITLKTYREYVEAASIYFFPFINEAKRTRLNNLPGSNLSTEEFMSAVVINCIIKEIEDLFDRKLVTTKSDKIKFEFTDAQGVVLYKTLIHLPLPREQVYFNQIRQEWILIIDQELIRLNLYHNNQPQKQSYATDNLY